ncbi:aldose 1-epimerase family protein [Tabrizicola sp. J26]|uniref:aldose 1-epimerase family protein n=1 Tax=Alitabrizicola rongguiensis TaxID=2909234 RepID=UPI001F2FD2AC|nr:aldose 1-epimerase family protein [Tabrizicola rongguiensis]MCF1707223.1 aldose 1-epimerase family protein [Tabrizicola rongguiensis]
MPQLFGRNVPRRDAAALSGALSQFGGVRLMTLGDGVERGIRLLEFRTATGLRFTVLVDRAMDIAEVEHKGRAVGWHSQAGFRNPALHEYEGEDGFAFARSFSGFLVTCGLDHILGPQTVSAENYNYPGRSTIRHSLHGRIGTVPARLTGYGERWEGDRCILWAEGVVQQAAVFGENLHLIRRIEADLDGDEIRLTDSVVNAGFVATPHMFFYHVNVGHPVLDEGARYLAPINEVLWAAHAGARYRAQGVGYARIPAPRPDFAEQVWQHELAPDQKGEVPVAVVNDRIGFGIEVVTRKDQLPCLYEWQHFQQGAYALGIEPSTHHVLGNLAARERGEMIWLGPQDERRYDATFRVLDGAVAIAAAEARIAAIARQPDDPYPEPTGRFPPLSGRPQPNRT